MLGQHDYRPHYWFVPKRIDVDWAKSEKNTFSQLNQGFELGQRVLKQLLELAKDQKTRKIKPKKNYPIKIALELFGCQSFEFIPQPDPNFRQAFVNQMRENNTIIDTLGDRTIQCDSVR